MVSSPSSSPVLRSPPSPHLSRSLMTQLSPVPATLRCRHSVHRIAATAAPFTTCASTESTRSPSSVAASSFYEVLEIPMGASSDDIKAAYRRLARICHPDVAAAGDRKESPPSGASGDEFIRIHAAYSTLSDPGKRADYDRKLWSRRIRPLGSFNGDSASATSSFCKYPRRNWETDQCW